jgi:WD40 repeat protein
MDPLSAASGVIGLLSTIGKASVDMVKSLVFSLDGEDVVAGSADGTVQIWDLGTWRCIKKLTGHSRGFVPTAVVPEYVQVVTGSLEGTVKLWDLPTDTYTEMP